MAKKPPKSVEDADSEGILIPIEYDVPQGLSSRFANYMTIQQDGHEFYLSFFEITPPLALGTPEQRREQLKELGSVKGTCVARIVFSAERMPGIVEVLHEQVEKYKSRKEEGSKRAATKKTTRRSARNSKGK